MGSNKDAARALAAQRTSASAANARALIGRLVLQLRARRQRFERRHAVHVDRGELLAQRIDRRIVEEPELTLRFARRAGQRRPSAARQLVALERRQDFARAVDDRSWKAGETRHL